MTAALRLQLGSLVGGDLEETPPFYRFYSGGGGTVRGQDYQSLGVDLGGGDRSGGLSFAGVSAEIRGTVNDRLQLVGFYDWGYVGAESFPDLNAKDAVFCLTSAAVAVAQGASLEVFAAELFTKTSEELDLTSGEVAN